MSSYDSSDNGSAFTYINKINELEGHETSQQTSNPFNRKNLIHTSKEAKNELQGSSSYERTTKMVLLDKYKTTNQDQSYEYSREYPKTNYVSEASY